MKCSVIRDLLPLYEEKLCRAETVKLLEEHLKNCSECKILYDDMHEDIGLKEVVGLVEPVDSYKLDIEHEFWMKYYGNLILRSVAIFLMVYIITISIGMIFKM
ncbi:zf-HC2 domain-containing protein [Clostridium sp. FP2]|uniref:zf-HC2 domain-containing protein n=1 Tax=Clostridium sp. FP2 TaxID=2724481 RepID=UPI0013E93B63|nr:zf-HC2 domain-containing protein [Clostridium sp. FP2]MBZ9621788.1 zf-HC2 domain-containing protein [Clostridium sp. FP2]